MYVFYTRFSQIFSANFLLSQAAETWKPSRLAPAGTLEAGHTKKFPHIFVPTSDLRDLRILCGLLTFFRHQNPWGLWKKWSKFPIPANLRDSNLCRWQKVSENKWLLVRFPSKHTGWCIDGYTKNRTPSPKQGDHFNGSSWVWLKCSYFTKIWDFSQKNFEIFFC